jgi:hypothetical protein
MSTLITMDLYNRFVYYWVRITNGRDEGKARLMSG